MQVHAHQLMTKVSPSLPPIIDRQLVTVDPDASLEEVARAMIEHRVHQVFVVEQGLVEGVVTAFDLLRRFTEPVSEAAVEFTGYHR